MSTKTKSKLSKTEDLKMSLHSKIGNEHNYVSVQFEVFGKVQGVYFRKFTRLECKKLGINGWVMNTPRGTVIGVMEGEDENIQRMQYWLQFKGSPKSNIEKVKFWDKQKIERLNFTDFNIKR